MAKRYFVLSDILEQEIMYAVIKSGGKQHRVTIGETLKLEKIEAATGESIQFDEVLLVADGENFTIGAPLVSGAAVAADIVSHGRGDKVKIIKFRRRKHSMKRQGHRQWYTEVKITDILTSGAKPSAKPKKAAAPIKAVSGADDLTRISGVGPVIVGKLKNLGITEFKQIAVFTPEDVERIDGELNFKGRIERDEWIAQAKEFMKGE